MEWLKGGSDADLMSVFGGEANTGTEKFCVSRIGIMGHHSGPEEGEELPTLSSARELRKRVAQVNAKKFLVEADQRMTSEEQLEDAAAAAASAVGNLKQRGRHREWDGSEEERRRGRGDEEEAPDDKDAFMAVYADTVRGCGTTWLPRDVKTALELAAENELQEDAVEHRDCSHGREKEPSEVYGNALMDMRRAEVHCLKERAQGREVKWAKVTEDDDFDRLALESAIVGSRDRLRRFENLSKSEGTEMFLLMGDKVTAGITAVGSRSARAEEEEEEEVAYFSCSDDEFDDCIEEQQREIE